MSRNTGPRVKTMRALGMHLPGLSRKTIDRRPYPPGQHGQNRRRKISDYGRQLKEKQKLRFNYGLTEKQMRRLFKEAKGSKMETGEKLVELLERRLDNVVFRAGLAPTIPAARQLVRHGHIKVNGQRVNIPSYRVRERDVVHPKEKSANLVCIQESLQDLHLTRPTWFEWDSNRLTVKVVSMPNLGDVPFPLEVHLVVEYYNKRV